MTDGRIEITVNGTYHTVAVPSDRLLVDLLRGDLGLTGTKDGCGVGICGLCSVIVDGELLSSCLLPAVMVDGSAIETVEGLANGDALDELQDAFIRCGGFQCGICTSGQLMAGTALIRERLTAADEIREWMSGNLCRCTGYEGILNAILDVVDQPSPADER